MQGFVLVDGVALQVALLPGLTLADGRAVSLSSDGGRELVTIGDVSHALDVVRDGDDIWVHYAGNTYHLLWQDPVTHHAGSAVAGSGSVARSPMPGVVVQLLGSPGDDVAAGSALMIIESMKLETTIRAPRDGRIETIHAGVGQSFERDVPLVTLTEES